MVLGVNETIEEIKRSEKCYSRYIFERFGSHEKDFRKKILIGIALLILGFAIAWAFAISYFNDNPGYYDYSVDIQGLNSYEPGLITDIIVPLPVRDGAQVFPDEELQYKSFGSWTSVLVVTEYGKMLAFQSIGRNLTNLHAEFSHKFREGGVIKNITVDSLSPVLPHSSSSTTQWISGSGKIKNFTTVMYIPDSLHSKISENIAVQIELTANGGMKHSVTDKTYRATISEKIPPYVRNMTPVTAQIGILDASDLKSPYKWVPAPP